MASGTCKLVSPAAILILILLAISLFDCSVFVPSIPAILPKIVGILSHNRSNYDCEICGAILEGIDILHSASSDRLEKNEATPSVPKINSELRGCLERSCPEQSCIQQSCPEQSCIQRSCPTQNCPEHTCGRPSKCKDVNAEQNRYAQRYCQNLLDSTLNIFETQNTKNDAIVSFVWANQQFFCHYIIEQLNYGKRISGVGPLVPQTAQPTLSTKALDTQIAYGFPAPSRVSRPPYAFSYYTHTWFLRYPLNPLHQERCYKFCEGTLNLKENVQLFWWRQLVIYNVHQRLYACRHVYPWFVRTMAILAFLLSQALGSYTSLCLYSSKPKDLDSFQAGSKDSSSRIDRNGVSLKGPNLFNKTNGSHGGGNSFTVPLDTYYSTRSGQVSKRKKK